MSWWRSLYLRNALKLEDETLQLVAQYVHRVQGKYPERMMQFAIDGEDEAVLAEMVEARNKDYEAFWAPDARATLSYEAENQLFEDIQILHPVLCYRLAKLYEALNSYLLMPLGWLHPLLARISPHGLFSYLDLAESTTLPINASFIEQILHASGEPANKLADIVYFANPEDYSNARQIAVACVSLQGFEHYSMQHIQTIREALQQKQSIRRSFVLEILFYRQVSIEPFMDLVVRMAFSSRKGERELATKYLKQDINKSVPWIQSKAINGKLSERDRAIQILVTLQGEKAKDFLETRLSSEVADQVKLTIQTILSTFSQPKSSVSITLPSIANVNPISPLSKAISEIIQPLVETKSSQLLLQPGVVWRSLEQGTAQDCAACLRLHQRGQMANIAEPFLKVLMERKELSPLHALRCLILFGYCPSTLDYREIDHRFFEFLNIYHISHPDSGFREFAVALDALGVPSERLGNLYLQSNSPWGGLNWKNEAIWPYFYERPELLIGTLNVHPELSYYQEYKGNALHILEMLPTPPLLLIPILWELALGNAKTVRPITQNCLDSTPNVTARLLETLQLEDAQIRAIAAEWLANRNDTVAIVPLKKLLLKEKSDVAKVVFTRSLERLGASIDEFLNRDQLLADAQKGLKKGVPEALSWLPFTDLPPIYWADNQQLVDSTILVWLIVQSYKQKSPEPNPLLQRYAQMLQESDRLALGNFVLNRWIAQDTATYTQEEAEFLARKNLQIYGQYLPPNKTQEQFYQEHLNYLLTQVKGSAIKEKGILAIASACVTGATAVPIVKKYLDTWYGNRSAQCNALLQMLSWIEDNAAIQYLLSVANRFRTRSIQKEAAKLIQAIAERHQWTPEELGDRTIPTAGFSPAQTLTLDYGSRQFTLTLDARLNPILKNVDGKILKSLPTPNQQDDLTLVATAKTTYNQTKKELKQVLQIQKTRLYEAMTVQRSWSYSDWESLLNQHPIIRLYTQSLVWNVYENNTLIQTIRPLGDGTLTTQDDREATLNPDSVLRLAHTSLMSPNDVQTWNAHLSDYEIVPPFMQFWIGLYTIPSDPEVTDLSDFQNQTLKSFHLRGRATQRGYNRGPTGDSGYFWTYHKTFSSISIEAVIEFSGNRLPEENIEVEMQGLYFYKPGDRSVREVYDLSFPNKLPLQSVPPVLLQECWNDLRHIMSAS